jgi:hypothetical protein
MEVDVRDHLGCSFTCISSFEKMSIEKKGDIYHYFEQHSNAPLRRHPQKWCV